MIFALYYFCYFISLLSSSLGKQNKAITGHVCERDIVLFYLLGMGVFVSDSVPYLGEGVLTIVYIIAKFKPTHKLVHFPLTLTILL